MLELVDAAGLADVIITGRGGGSLEDLWAFNEEIVARAIARCDIPVISAVGHEPDVTIADFAADVRAATPSNGAEIAVCDQSELRDALGQLTVRLTRAQDRRISALTDRLNRLKASPVMRSPEGAIQQRELLLELLRQRHEGLIALSACLAGAIPQALMNESYASAKAYALQMADIMGEGNFYLELQNHGIPEQHWYGRRTRSLRWRSWPPWWSRRFQNRL